MCGAVMGAPEQDRLANRIALRRIDRGCGIGGRLRHDRYGRLPEGLLNGRDLLAAGEVGERLLATHDALPGVVGRLVDALERLGGDAGAPCKSCRPHEAGGECGGRSPWQAPGRRPTALASNPVSAAVIRPSQDGEACCDEVATR
jgi:hypothetical protein